MPIMNTKLIQRIHNTNSKEVLHSSVYGKAQAEGGLRVSHNDTFSARRKLEHNRQYVQGYNRSEVMQGGNRMPKAVSVEDATQTTVVQNTDLSNTTNQQTPLQKIQAQADTSNDWYANQTTNKAAAAAADAARDAALESRGYGRTSSSEMTRGYGRITDSNYGYGRTAGSDTNRGYGRTAGSDTMRGYGRTSSADLRQQKMNGYASAAAQREARANRFAGGVRTANGGTISARPATRPPMSFGRH